MADRRIRGGFTRRTVPVDLEGEVVRELCESRRSVDRMAVQALEAKEQILAFKDVLERMLSGIDAGNRLLGECRNVLREFVEEARR